MATKNINGDAARGKHENPLPQEIGINEKVQHRAAKDNAEHDMEDDAELTSHHPNDDLDEGETARLGEDTSDVI